MGVEMEKDYRATESSGAPADALSRGKLHPRAIFAPFT